MKFRFPFFLLALALLCACKPSKPSGVLSESRMIPLLVDYHLAQGMAEGGEKEIEDRYVYVQAVFRKHRITEAEFDKSMVYYCQHAEDLDKIYVQVNRRMEAAAAMLGMDTQTQLKYHELSNTGDTANVWNRKKMALLKPNYLENIYSFFIEADTSIYTGDSFMWTFEPQYVSQGGGRDGYVQLSICYENDSVASNSQVVSGSQELKIKVSPSHKQDTLRIKSVQGHVYLPQAESEEKNFRMLLLRNIALVRYHKPGAKSSAQPVVSADTLAVDSVEEVQTDERQSHRLSPSELRDAQPRDQRINVVKEKPLNPRLRPSRNINQPVRRRKP